MDLIPILLRLLTPERDFCPFKPFPEYVPVPEALPRPILFLFFVAPLFGLMVCKVNIIYYLFSSCKLLNASIVHFALLTLLVVPIILLVIFLIPANSKTTLTTPPAITPWPDLAGLNKSLAAPNFF